MYQQRYQQGNRVCWPDDEPYSSTYTGQPPASYWAGDEQYSRFPPSHLGAGYAPHRSNAQANSKPGRHMEGHVCPYCGHSLSARERSEWRAYPPQYGSDERFYHRGGGQGQYYRASGHDDQQERLHSAQGRDLPHHSVFAFQAGRRAGAFRGNGSENRLEVHTEGSSRGGHDDPDYAQWREEQIRLLDQDYGDFRRERYGKFASDFNSWRSKRAGDLSSTATASSRASSRAAGKPASEQAGVAAPETKH